MNADRRSKGYLKHAAALVGLLLFGGGQAWAEAGIGTFKGSDLSTACIGADETCRLSATSREKPVVKARVDWNVSVLVGEPVVDTRLAWKPDNVFGSVQGFVAPIYGAADPDLFYKSAEAAAQLRLYEAKARLTVHHGNQTYTIESDLGVPDKPGEKLSYNVAGSPSWDRLFRDDSGAFVPAETAREIVSSGSMAGAEASLVSAEVDTTKFEEWWLDKNVDRYAAPLRKAIDGRLAALEESFGLPTEELRAEIAELGRGLPARARLDRLESILRKLAPDRIPGKFLGEGPERQARLHRYALSISATEDTLRVATKGLPPMPGASKAYETWYDQVAVRMNTDAARLARLQGLEADALRAEQEAEAARQRAEKRAADERERIAAARERERRRTATEPQKSFSEEFGYPEDDSYSGNSGFADTGWVGLMNSYVMPGSGTYYDQVQGSYVSPGSSCETEKNAVSAVANRPSPDQADRDGWAKDYEDNIEAHGNLSECLASRRN
jgi:hypothetical protein